MRGGDFPAALDALASILAADPDDGEAAYLKAVCLRFQRRFDDARRELEQLLEREPENGRALQECAHLARDTGQLEEAVHHYGAALRANPALVASYRHRLELLTELGRDAEARATAAQLERLQSLPAALVAVTDLLAQGRRPR